MMALGLILSIFFLPNINRVIVTEVKPGGSHALHVLKEFDFTRVFKPMVYPNVSLTVSRPTRCREQS